MSKTQRILVWIGRLTVIVLVIALFAGAYQAMGCPVYSSAVFNFAPRMAMDFYTAHAAGETAACDQLIRDFFLPYIALRNRGEGYAVSIVKAAGVRMPIICWKTMVSSGADKAEDHNIRSWSGRLVKE